MVNNPGSGLSQSTTGISIVSASNQAGIVDRVAAYEREPSMHPENVPYNKPFNDFIQEKGKECSNSDSFKSLSCGYDCSKYPNTDNKAKDKEQYDPFKEENYIKEKKVVTEVNIKKNSLAKDNEEEKGPLLTSAKYDPEPYNQLVDEHVNTETMSPFELPDS